MIILADEQIPDVTERLADVGDVRTFVGRELTRDDLIASSAEVLLVRSTTKVNGALLEGTAVRFVGSATAGIDHVDTAWLDQHSIAFAYAPGSNAPAVVQYVLTVIDQLRSFDGTTLGIIGYGHVGSLLASAAEKYGATVLVNDPPLMEAGRLDRAHTELTDLLQRSDVVSLHVPLTQDGAHPTFHLLEAETLKHLRAGTLLINTARGGVIDESAIPDSIDLVLDVFEGEPYLNRRSIERATIVTPHIAGYTLDAKQRGARMVEGALREFLFPSRVSRGVPPQAAGRGPEEQRTESREQQVLTPNPRRLDSNLKEAWLVDPTPPTFDRCRKEYVLV